MKKFLKFITSRLVFTAFFVLVQAVILFMSLRYFESHLSLSLSASVIAFLVSFAIFSRNDLPEYKLSWILFIMFIPVFGILMYLLFGNKKNSRKQRKQIELYKKVFSQNSIDSYPKAIKEPEKILSDDDNKLCHYVQNLADSRVFGNTSVKYYSLGDYCFVDMLKELDKASSFIFMEYFIYERGLFWDSILEILKRKASEGIEVRVLYDDMGCINTLPKDYYKTLRSYNIKAVAFNPVRARLNYKLNYRDHRKVCIIDGNVAFSGGINIADEYINHRERFGHWKDNGFLVRGEGVWNYTYMFLQTWDFSAPKEYKTENYMKYIPTKSEKQDSYIQSFGDSPMDDLNVAENAYMHIINNAKKYVWICTPYLILDSTMTNSLTLAARSGVDVRIITPGIPDKKTAYALTRSSYAPLLANGVKIYEYTPGFIHAKMFISDDRLSIAGTINMDYRSFFLHFESGSIFYGGSVIEDIKKDFSQTFGLCHQVTLEEYQKRSRFQRLLGHILKVAAPLM